MSKIVIHRKHMLRVAVLLALGTTVSAVYAATSNNNFTMLDTTGSTVGGTNDVVFSWDGSLNTNPATAVSNATLSSATPFFGLNWTAHNVKIYGPGTYTLSTVDTLGSADCPGAQTCVSAGDYNVTVAPGQIMAHMKFAWGATQGIDVVDVWETGNWTILNPSDSIFTGPGGTYSGPSYSRTSIDWNADGNAGAGMIDGPFSASGGFSANFNVSVVGGEGIPEIPVETQLTTTEPSTAGGGCSINSMPSSAMERADWWIVVGFLAWLGAIRRQFSRQTLS